MNPIIIHASRTGGGPRPMVLELLGHTSDPIDAATQKIFDDGNKFEEVAIRQVLSLDEAEYDRPFEGKDSYMTFDVKLKGGVAWKMSCSTDAVLTTEFKDDREVYPAGTFIEVKNVGYRSFKKYTNQKRLSDKYKAQAQCYLWAAKKSNEGKLVHTIEEDGNIISADPIETQYNAKKLLYIIRNKQTRECRAFPVYWDDEVQQQILSDCAEAVRNVMAGTYPDCDCTNHFCRYKQACQELKKGVQVELNPAFWFNVSGTTFHKTELKFLEDMEINFKDMKAELVPDPDNPYDANAIKVVVDDQHIGYVPREHTEHTSSLIGDGWHPRVFNLNARDVKPFAHIILLP